MVNCTVLFYVSLKFKKTIVDCFAKKKRLLFILNVFYENHQYSSFCNCVIPKLTANIDR